MSISKLFNSDLHSDRLIVTALLVAVTIASWLFVLNGGGMGMPAHKILANKPMYLHPYLIIDRAVLSMQ